MPSSQTTMDFPLLPHKSLQVDFTGGALSSDGGLVLLAQLDQRLRLTQRVAACIHDPRLPERIQHPLRSLLQQRLYQIAAGYEDANDATSLRHDPVLKLALGRGPETDAPLASQPTLSRLEGQVSEAECAAINRLLLEVFLEGRRKAPAEIVLDFDTSEDPTHGQQEFAFFNGHYGSYCYLPLFVFARAKGEAEEFLVSAELRDCAAKDMEGILATLQRLVERLRQRFPGVKLLFRGDAWFGSPDLYDWCEDHEVAYAIGLASNAVLQRLSQSWREEAAAAAKLAESRSAQRFGEFDYQAAGWRQARRVVVKAEVTPFGPNPRYVVVSGREEKPRAGYQFYSGRGESENRIKELKGDLQSDRTSCHAFAGNQFRLLLASLAYVLFQGLRRAAQRTGLGRAQVSGLRLALIKIAARVKESQRRVVLELCSACPSQSVFRVLARRLGVVSG